MRRIWPIFWKEFLHIFRDPRTLASILVIPILMMLLFAYALTFDVKHIRTTVRDADLSSESRALVDAFRAAKYFEMHEPSSSLADINRAISQGDVMVALDIPRGFGKRLAAGETAQVGIAIDGSDPIIARAAFNYAGSISQSFSRQTAAAYVARRTGSPLRRAVVTVNPRVLYNPDLTSINFIVPGLIALFLMMIPAVLTSVAIVREKERHTIEQIIVSPVKPFELMVGKIMPYLVIASFDALLISLVGVYWFGVPFEGSVSLLVLLTLLYMIATLSLGIFISTVATTQQVAQLAAFLLTMLPSFLFSGFVFPISSMPVALQYVTYAVPARYFLVILRGIFLKGVGLSAFWPEVLSLAAFALVMMTISSLRFRKRLA